MEISRSSIRSCTMVVSSCGDRPAEVTAMRITGWALASALTISGWSAVSGSWLTIRATASRTSVAATSISTLSLNSSVTRDRPKRELDEIDRTPDTRPTAPSIRPVSSWSTVSGEAPSNRVVTVTTGRSTLGSSRISAPNNPATPASTISAFSTKARIGLRTNSAVPEDDVACVLTACHRVWFPHPQAPMPRRCAG